MIQSWRANAGRRLLPLSGLLLCLLYALGPGHTESAGIVTPRPHLQDLYEIFQDEIRPNHRDNVFRHMGNRFQLDGRVYQRVWQALDAYEVLEATLSSRHPGQQHEEALQRREARAQELFEQLIAGLPWPRYTVRLRPGQIECSVDSRSPAYQSILQPVLIRLENLTREPTILSLESSDVELSPGKLEVEPGLNRYLLASFLPSIVGLSGLDLSISGGSRRLDTRLEIQVEATAVLEGVLTEEKGLNAPLARVRVTDGAGRYFPPHEARSGLIIRVLWPHTGQRAQRWFYAQGSFKVRVPAGPVHVSLRRGLEYRAMDRRLSLGAGETVKQEFLLSRWVDMEGRDWYSGDAHVHLLDPETTLLEMRAEDLRVANVLVLDHRGNVTAREHFTGALDPVSTSRHLVYYGEEYRHGRLGHVGFLALRRLIEPVSIGRLGLPAPGETRVRYQFHLSQSPLPSHGAAGWPDYPLLLRAMKEVRRQGGLVNWAHLRKSQWEFPVDIALGQVDTVDLLTNTQLDEALKFWYDLLNCGFLLGPTAGTDRAAPATPLGHQRVYVRVDPPFTYPRWIEGLRKGASFVTNGPMLDLEIQGLGPGGRLELSAPRSLRIRASALSQLPFEKLEIVSNGEILQSVESDPGGRKAQLDFQLQVGESRWIAARCLGTDHPEIHSPHPLHRHPVVAHTGAVYLDFKRGRVEHGESACSLLDFLQEMLVPWMEGEAYFASESQREESLATIRQGMQYYEEICGRR